MILNDKKALTEWDKFRESIRKSTPVDLTETLEAKKKRIAALEADPEAWKRYYFPQFFKYPSPKFHKAASNRIINKFQKLKHWYEVRHWARGLAKTTTTMMDVLYLVMTGKLKNIIYTSSTYDAAENFLTKYQSQLDSNQRLINDYGKQELPGSWTMGNFTTRKGVKMMALGAGQSPRGNGNEEIRPDCIIVDDFDTDSECLNPEIIDKKWNWFEQALFFTVDTAEPYLIIFLGNIIAEDCCVVRAGKMADHCETINIRENGKSVWPEKNSEADIDYQLSKVSYESGRKEMFNDPLSAGKTFKEITWGKCPPIKQLPFIVSYSDPATSNKDKPNAKSKAFNSCKVVVLLGYWKDKFYLYDCFDDNMSNDNFIDCMYQIDKEGSATVVYNYIENNTLQDPFWEQVLKPLLYEKRKEQGRATMLNVIPDGEKKGEKWFRIEATLEPLVRLGTLVFNQDKKENPHMKRMVAQFLTAKPTSKELGGPDATEGAVTKIKQKLAELNPQNSSFGARKTHSKRF
ncbi:MAG: hypothetical protein KGM16_17790 [Bacteroidota bacterium]|nr:hypothetical protein [Bacteroidota bacterium]